MNIYCDCNEPHGAGLVPGPCIPKKCREDKEAPRIFTQVLPESAGTDEKGQPYAPKFGAHYNTIVQYSANDAIIFYDSQGIWTKIVDDSLKETLAQEIEDRKAADEALSQDLSAKILDEAKRAVQAEQWLQENINKEVMAREADRDNLQTNINAEVNRATAAEGALDERIDAIINSPDVRYIEDTYADLEAIPKADIGDQDYARVLQDETHEGASTYYQFHTATQEWEYVGQTGPYYTKTEADNLLATKQDILVGEGEGQNIKTVNGESLLGSGDIGGSGNDSRLTDDGASRANNLPTTVATSGIGIKTNTEGRFIVSSPVISLADGSSVDNEFSFPMASGSTAGMMAASDKTKLNRVPQTVVSGTGISQTSDDKKTSILVQYKNTATGETYDDKVEIPTVSKIYNGLMTVEDKAKLDLLTGETVLYTGTASVNTLTLSEAATNFEELEVHGETSQTIGSTSFTTSRVERVAIENGVSAFKMEDTILTDGANPSVMNTADFWSISADGMDLDLVRSLVATTTTGTTVTSEPTSHFTITKVIGIGRKS